MKATKTCKRKALKVLSHRSQRNRRGDRTANSITLQLPDPGSFSLPRAIFKYADPIAIGADPSCKHWLDIQVISFAPAILDPLTCYFSISSTWGIRWFSSIGRLFFGGISSFYFQLLFPLKLVESIFQS